MSDELKKLQDAFTAEEMVMRNPSAKAKGMIAAMHAFDQEKIIAANQGNANTARLNHEGNEKKTLFDWRHKLQNINSRFVYGMMGSASIAALALIVVGPNVQELLQQSGKPIVGAERGITEELDHVEDLSFQTSRLQDKTLTAPKPVERRLVEPKQQVTSKLFADSNGVRQQALIAPSSQLGAKRLNEVQNLVAPTIANDTQIPQYQDVGRDKFSTIETNPVKVVKEEPVSTFSVDVDTASYSFMRSAIDNNQLPQKNAVRVEELINYFDYGYEAPTDKLQPFASNVSIMPTPWNEGTKLMSIGIKGYEIAESDAPASNLVFLIDTSGSMNAHNKLPLLRNSFKMLLSSLKQDDTISIVTYAGSAGTVLEPTKVKDKNKILAALDNLHAGGSTAGAAGIRQAYALAEQNMLKEGVNRVILATDGDFNVGITNTEELKSYIERKRDTGVTLSVLGFGRGNYNDQLMQTLAQNGNGNAAYIDTLTEARKVLVEEAGSSLFTIAKDVKLQVEFNPALVSEYRLVGYETRELKHEDFNNDKVDAGDIGAGHTVTALYEITPVNSDAKLVDDLRYGTNQTDLVTTSDEYGFLKIRYKQPDSDTSELISRSITIADEVSDVQSAPQASRFASSVAAFGQLLRGGQYTGEYAYDDVIKLANSAKGEDEFGYRAEFINLVRLAKSIAGQ